MTTLEKLLRDALTVLARGKESGHTTTNVAVILLDDLAAYIAMFPKGEDYSESHTFTVGDLLRRKEARR